MGIPTSHRLKLSVVMELGRNNHAIWSLNGRVCVAKDVASKGALTEDGAYETAAGAVV